MNRRRVIGASAAACASALLLGSVAAAQQPGGRGRSGGPAGPRIAAVPFEDRAGFESMFDGRSLTPGADQQKTAAGRGGGRGQQVSRFQDWDGDPTLWRVENGTIVGESTPEKVVDPNTFLIWRGGTPGDFELKVEMRMNATNSGIQYRSRMLPPGTTRDGRPGHAWRLAGYQMDMDFANVYSGQLYEEAGRGFLAERGTAVYITPDGAKGVVGQVGSAEGVKGAFKPGEWNQFHLIARGSTLIHIVNGVVTAVCVDDDLKGRSLGGLIGFQLHGGDPMKLELRNVAIRLR